MAWDPVVQDIIVMSGGAAVLYHSGVGIFAGVFIAVGNVGVRLSSLRVFGVGVFHDSAVGLESEVSVSMPEWTGQGSAHRSDLDVGESVIMPEWIGHDSAHKLLLSFIVVGVVTVGGSSVAFFTATGIAAAASLTCFTMSLQLMLQVGVMASVVVGTVVVLL